MRIGIDSRFSDIAGIARYAKNLIGNLEKIDSQNEYFIFLLKKNTDWYQPKAPNFTKVIANYPYYSFVEQLLFPFKIRQAKIDLMHFLNFNVPVLYFGKYVLTIHDLIHEEYSTFGMTTQNKFYYLLKKIMARLVLRWSCLRAIKILVPSQATKNDLIKVLKIPEQKIVVTYEGIDESWLNNRIKGEADERFLADYGIKKPYLLYVSTMYPYKNHRILIDAFSELIAERPSPFAKASGDAPRGFMRSGAELQLILVAKDDSFSQKIRSYIKDKGLEADVVMSLRPEDNGFINDDKLKIIFRNAFGYITPSKKEGFGLTILEAWASGLPVLASDIPVLREIGQDGILYFNPNNIMDIKEAIKRVLSDESLRNQLIARGIDRLESFSWQKMVGGTLGVYRMV